MDIAKITTGEQSFEITHPATGENLGVTITMMAPKDDRLKSVRDKILQKKMALQAKGKAEKVEDVRQDRHTILFKAITDWKWSGDATFRGEKPELNPKNFNDICEALPWFVDQIDEHFGDVEKFYEGNGAG